MYVSESNGIHKYLIKGLSKFLTLTSKCTIKNVKFCCLRAYQMALKWMKVQHQQDLFATNSMLIKIPLQGIYLMDNWAAHCI